MASKTFTSGTVIDSAWLNDVNTQVYKTHINVKMAPYNAKGDGVTDDTAAIQSAENAAAISGQSLYFPFGTYKYTSVITKKSVNWIGDGQDRTTLKYYGTGISINATGTSSNRVICTIENITCDGTSAGINAECISFGWNMRSYPLLRNVRIFNFPHYGIHFNDQNWLVKFENVFIDTCGRTVNNSCGIFKDANITGGTWNDIIFDTITCENCGNSSSNAGAWNLNTNAPQSNRGIYLINCCSEGNYGTDEMYFQNTADLQITNVYIERVNNVLQPVGIDIDSCTGSLNGGFITAAGAFGTRGLRLNNSIFTVSGFNFGYWSTASIDSQSSTLFLYGNFTGQLGVYAPLLPANILVTGNSQLYGDICPKVSAHKNGIDQINIPTAVFTKVTFGTSVYDSVGSFSSSTFTPKSIGTYQIDAQITWNATTDQDRPIISIYVNGLAYKSSVSQASGTGAVACRISAQIPITAVTDTIEIYARQTSGANQTISGSTADTWFTSHLIGRN